MRFAKAPKVASVLLMLATSAPSLAWGADGIDVIRAGTDDLRAFDQAIRQSRARDEKAAPTTRSGVKAAVGAKVSSEAGKVLKQRERDIQDRKGFGQWVKSNNNPSGGKGSAATVGDNGSGTGGSSSSTRDRNESGGKGKNSGKGNSHD